MEKVLILPRPLDPVKKDQSFNFTAGKIRTKALNDLVKFTWDLNFVKARYYVLPRLRCPEVDR